MTTLGDQQGLTHICVSGSSRECGRQYGQAASGAISESLAAYEALFRYYSNIDWAEARKRALAYVPAVEAYGSRYLEEMAGIAEGAACDFEDILALNVRSELRYAGPVSALTQSASPQGTDRGECTAVVALPSATADGHTLLAQNWDWKTHARVTNLLLEVHQKEGPDYVTLVEAGLLAKAGMNDCGLGLVTNTLVSSLDRGEPGVPYHVVLRSILDCESISDALGRVLSASRSSSANYLLASGDGLAVNLECLQGDSAGVLAEAPHDGLFAHANHFRHAHASARDLGLLLIPDSFFRQERLDDLLRERPISVPLLQAALRDHANHPDGICAHEHEDEQDFLRSATISSLIMDLSATRMWVADGNPCQRPYFEMDYTTRFPGSRGSGRGQRAPLE
jgi:isopenicillin-N N-acyltransferase-like protein